MNERFSTQKIIKESPERISEKVKLRELIQGLEKKAGHAHGAQADTLESEILTNEENLRTVEKDSLPSQETLSATETTKEVSPLTQEPVIPSALQNETTPETAEPVSKPSSDNRAEDFAERAQVGEARAKMIAAEAEYLGAFRRQHKDQGALARLAGKNSPEKIQRDRTQELREVYDKSRADFANAVNLSAQKRFDTKHGRKSSDVKLRTQEAHKEKVLHRYNRMVVSSDVIKRSLQEKARAKQEGLDESGRLSLGKALKWYTRGNQALEKKVGKVAARGIRILAFATIGSATGGVLAVGHRVIRSGLGALFGTVAGANAGRVYEKKWGKASAKEYQNKSEQAISSVEDIAAQEKSYKRGSTEAIAHKRHLVEALTAMFVGAGTSVETAQFFSNSHAVHTAVENLSPAQVPHEVVAHIDQQGEGADALFGHLKESLRTEYPDASVAPPIVEHVSPTINGLTHHEGMLSATNGNVVHDSLGNVVRDGEGNPVHAGTYGIPSAPEVVHHSVEGTTPLSSNSHAVHTAVENLSPAQVPHEVVAHIDQQGEGADALFGHLKESLRTEYPDASVAPPEVQHILDTRLHELSTEYGFAKQGESGVMSMHDTLSYNPSDSHLVFTNTHGAHVLESTSNGELVKGAEFNQFDGHYTHDVIPHTSVDEGNAPTSEIATPVAPPIVEHVSPTINGLTHHEGMLSATNGNVVHDSLGNVVRDGEGNPVHAGTYGIPSAPEVVHHSVEGTTPLPTPESATAFHHEVSGLLQNDALGKYAHTSVSDVLYQSPEVSPQLHEQLIETVAHSGVGPTNSESLEHYLHRANTLITERGTPTFEVGEHGLSIPMDQTQIYTDARGDLVVYGGDPSAQHLVAYQYLEKHPDARILFERGGHDEASGVNALTLHTSPLPSAESQPFQSFTPLRDSSGKIIKSINPHTLTTVVQ